MPFAQDSLDRFMSTYEQNTGSDDPAVLAAQFAPTFLAAGPDGASSVPLAAFAPKLLQRKRLFTSAGLQSTRLVARRDMPVGDRYALVYTQWRMDFSSDAAPAVSITVASSFLIDMGSPEPKILAYLAHQDIFQRMKESGVLLPG